MDTFNELTTAEQQIVYSALSILGTDIDAAFTILADEGLDLSFDDLQEIAEHFHLN